MIFNSPLMVITFPRHFLPLKIAFVISPTFDFGSKSDKFTMLESPDLYDRKDINSVKLEETYKK